MKNMFKKAQNKATELYLRARTAIECKKAEMYVDKGVGIIIAVVVGAVILAGIYALLKNTVLAEATTKVGNMFNYSA